MNFAMIDWTLYEYIFKFFWYLLLGFVLFTFAIKLAQFFIDALFDKK